MPSNALVYAEFYTKNIPYLLIIHINVLKLEQRKNIGMYFRSKCTHVTNSLVPRKSIMCKHMPTSLSKSFESFEKRKC